MPHTMVHAVLRVIGSVLLGCFCFLFFETKEGLAFVILLLSPKGWDHRCAHYIQFMWS